MPSCDERNDCFHTHPDEREDLKSEDAPGNIGKRRGCRYGHCNPSGHSTPQSQPNELTSWPHDFLSHRTELLDWGYGFNGHGFTLQSAFHRDFLCRVLIQFCFVAFERVDSLPDNEGILGPLLHAITKTFRIGLVLHHMGLAAHCITHDSG